MAILTTQDGGTVHYEHHAGAKTPIILIHGWAMSARIWYAQIEGLRRAGHEVIAIDHRGCGLSGRDFADVSIGAMAGDVVAIAEQAGLRPAIVNGWSLGGAIAAEAAARMGDKAAGLVLTCGASPRLTQAADFPYGAEAGAYDGLADGLLADRAGFFAALSAGVCAKDVGPATIGWMQSIFLDSGPMIYRALAEGAEMDQRQLLAGLSIPVLSIIGGKDAVLSPDIGRQAAQCAPQGRLLQFDDCGHAPFIEEPAAYLAALLDFAAQCAGKDARHA